MKLRKRQPERQPAMELREALEARGGTIRQAVRALLRDFGYGTVTPKACEEVQRRLEQAGIAYQLAFVGAKPSHMVTLSLAAPAAPAEPVVEDLVHEQAVADLEPQPEPEVELEPVAGAEPEVEQEPSPSLSLSPRSRPRNRSRPPRSAGFSR